MVEWCGVQGQILWRGSRPPGGSAPRSPSVLAYLKCPEKLSYNIISLKKKIDSIPKMGKSTLCYYFECTQQTKYIFCFLLCLGGSVCTQGYFHAPHPHPTTLLGTAPRRLLKFHDTLRPPSLLLSWTRKARIGLGRFSTRGGLKQLGW